MVYTVNGEQFTKRKLLKINTAAAVLADYQIKKTVPYLPAMQSGMADIRFTTLAGVNIIYWEESVTADTSADVWLKAPSISNTVPTYIWQYYGNPNVSSASSSSVFLQYQGSTTGDYDLANDLSYNSTIFEIKMTRTSSGATDMMTGLTSGDYNVNDGAAIDVLVVPIALYTWINGGGAAATSDDWVFPYNEEHVLKIVLNGTDAKAYYDGTLEVTRSTNIPDSNIGLYMKVYSGSYSQVWSRARKYAATEPTWGTDGVEQHQRRVPQFIN